MNKESKKLYEISFLLRSDADVPVVIDYVNSFGGEVVKEGSVKEIEFAYPIKNNKSGYFGYIKCALNSESINDISNALNFEDKILRFLIVESNVSVENNKKETNIKNHKQKEKLVEKKSEKEAKRPRTDISNELLEEKLEEILK